MLVARASQSLISPPFCINPINELSLNEEYQLDFAKVVKKLIFPTNDPVMLSLRQQVDHEREEE